MLRVIVFDLDEKDGEVKRFDQKGSSVVVGIRGEETTSICEEGDNAEISYCVSCLRATEIDRILDAREEG